MEKGTLFIFLALVFSSVFMISQLIFSFFSPGQRENRQIKKRMDVLLDKHQAALKVSLLRERYLKQLTPFEKKLESLPGMSKLEDFIDRSGHTFPAYQLALMCLATMLFGATLALTTQSVTLTIFVAAASLCLPVLKLKFDTSRRLARLEEQLPDALDMMTRALRAGYPFNEAMRLVATDMVDPIAKEFRIAFDEINYGLDMREALRSMIERNPSSLSLRAIVTTVLVQRETGGNLAETFKNIGRLIRGRFRFERRVRTLTAEARMSTMVMKLMPFAVFGILALVNPDYVLVLIHDPMGKNLLYAGGALLIMGTVWINMLAVEI